MPQLGVGTSTLKETAAECVKRAIGLGYRLVDAAQGYDNEAEVWYGIKESGIGRSEVFIISKVSPDAVRSGKVRESLDRTIEAFGERMLTSMLIHWPVARKVKERWRIMEKYVDMGKIRAIGVSNFNPHHVDELLAYARIKPVVNQIKIHPYMEHRGRGQHFCQRYSSSVMAPLGQGKINEIYDDEVLQYIIDRYHKTVRQVVLRFQIQSGMVIIPKTTHIERMKENLEMFDNEMEILRALDKGQPLIGNPQNPDFVSSSVNW